jgi:hypothetical protein
VFICALGAILQSVRRVAASRQFGGTPCAGSETVAALDRGSMPDTGYMLRPAALLRVCVSQVHPEHMRHIRRGPVRGPGLALTEHCQSEVKGGRSHACAEAGYRSERTSRPAGAASAGAWPVSVSALQPSVADPAASCGGPWRLWRVVCQPREPHSCCEVIRCWSTVQAGLGRESGRHLTSCVGLCQATLISACLASQLCSLWWPSSTGHR